MRMTRIGGRGAAMMGVAFLLGVTGCAAPARAAGQEPDSGSGATFHWTGTLAGGQTLHVRGINGSVHAETASGEEASVTATKHGRESEFDDVRIVVVKNGDGVTICTVYDDDRDDCDSGHHDHGRRGRHVSVDFEVRVPAGVRFEGSTVNGKVRIADLESDVSASSVNGDVEVSTSGTAEAHTVNGSLRVSMGKAPQNDMELHTVNGSIEVDVPDGTNADVEAEWVNGSLESDLPLRVQGRISPHRAEGKLGSGGPLLKMSTVNGSIHIR